MGFGPMDPGDDRVRCERCDGEGEIPTEGRMEGCPDCRGRGWVREAQRAARSAKRAAEDPYLSALVIAYLRAPSKSDEEDALQTALELACARHGLERDELVECIGEQLEDE